MNKDNYKYSNDFTVLSIDPGLYNCGTAILNTNRVNEKKIIFVETIYTQKLLHLVRDVEYKYGTKTAREILIINQLCKLVDFYDINLIVSESAFINPSRPAAYGALVEVITAIKLRVAIIKNIPFISIAPSIIKNTMGVAGGSKDKLLMKYALKQFEIEGKVINEKKINLDLLDEHSIDAVCIGLSYLNSI